MGQFIAPDKSQLDAENKNTLIEISNTNIDNANVPTGTIVGPRTPKEQPSSPTHYFITLCDNTVGSLPPWKNSVPPLNKCDKPSRLYDLAPDAIKNTRKGAVKVFQQTCYDSLCSDWLFKKELPSIPITPKKIIKEVNSLQQLCEKKGKKIFDACSKAASVCGRISCGKGLTTEHIAAYCSDTALQKDVMNQYYEDLVEEYLIALDDPDSGGGPQTPASGGEEGGSGGGPETPASGLSESENVAITFGAIVTTFLVAFGVSSIAEARSEANKAKVADASKTSNPQVKKQEVKKQGLEASVKAEAAKAAFAIVKAESVASPIALTNAEASVKAKDSVAFEIFQLRRVAKARGLEQWFDREFSSMKISDTLSEEEKRKIRRGFAYPSQELNTTFDNRLDLLEAQRSEPKTTLEQKAILISAMRASVGLLAMERDIKFECQELGIDFETATSNRKAWKQAYKKAALKHHPDRGGNKDNFQRLNNLKSYMEEEPYFVIITSIYL